MPTGHNAPTVERARIAATMAKAKVFREALPYIREFRGRTVVVKYGGSAMLDEELRAGFAGDIALLKLVGINPVVVHGGGPAISQAMRRAGLEPQWVDGLRVTGREELEVVRRVLAEEINPGIVRLLSGEGICGVGMSGMDGGLFTARRRPGLGFVGEVAGVRPEALGRGNGAGPQPTVPVIAPLARGEDGEVCNINADTVAGALAGGLGARKLVYLTDVEGLYRDLGDRDTLITRMSLSELRDLLATGTISQGMLPKLVSCVRALEEGVPAAHILDGRIQHALLLEVFTPEGIGTMITEKGE